MPIDIAMPRNLVERRKNDGYAAVCAVGFDAIPACSGLRRPRTSKRTCPSSSQAGGRGFISRMLSGRRASWWRAPSCWVPTVPGELPFWSALVPSKPRCAQRLAPGRGHGAEVDRLVASRADRPPQRAGGS